MTLAPLTFGTVVDIIAVMVVLFFLSRGLIRGVSEEVARIAGFGSGAWAGYALYPRLQAALMAGGGLAPSPALALTTLALAVLCGFIVGLAVRFLFHSMLQVVILQPADALFGLASGAAYAAVVLVIVFAIAMLLPIRPVQRVFAEQSRVGQLICPWLRAHMGLT